MANNPFIGNFDANGVRQLGSQISDIIVNSGLRNSQLANQRRQLEMEQAYKNAQIDHLTHQNGLVDAQAGSVAATMQKVLAEAARVRNQNEALSDDYLSKAGFSPQQIALYRMDGGKNPLNASQANAFNSGADMIQKPDVTEDQSRVATNLMGRAKPLGPYEAYTTPGQQANQAALRKQNAEKEEAKSMYGTGKSQKIPIGIGKQIETGVNDLQTSYGSDSNFLSNLDPDSKLAISSAIMARINQGMLPQDAINTGIFDVGHVTYPDYKVNPWYQPNSSGKPRFELYPGAVIPPAAAPAATTPPAQSGGGAPKRIDANTVAQYLQKAGGNVNAARQMAIQDGWSF